MVIKSKEDKRHQALEGCKLFAHVVTQKTSNHNLQAVARRKVAQSATWSRRTE